VRASLVFILLVVLAVAGTLLLRHEGPSTTGEQTAKGTGHGEGDGLTEAPPPLASGPPSIREAGTSAPRAEPASPDRVTIPRGLVRARLTAYDATTGQTVDSPPVFRWSFPDGCEEAKETTPRNAPVPVVEARLPAGAVETVVTVGIHEWGFHPAQRTFPLRVQDAERAEEVRVPLEPVEPALWHAVRLVRPGSGDRVTEAEALQLRLSSGTLGRGGPSHTVEFMTGSLRIQEVSVPFPPDELAVHVDVKPRLVIADGRHLWIEPQERDAVLRTADTSGPPTFAVASAVLEFDLRYPPGDRPEGIDLSGPWRGVHVAGPMRGDRYGSTFNVSVPRAPDVLRVERDPGELRSLWVRTPGFTFSVDPPPPYGLRSGETTRIVLEFRRLPGPLGK
jgi:hypothetical protein